MKIYIPEDLLTDILSRLPVKSLIRFSGVCSSWLHLIRSPDFIKSHHLKQTSLNDKNLCAFVKHDYYELFSSLLTKVVDDQEGAFDFPESFRIPFNLNVVGHCNGLLCLEITWTTIFIWNPATREIKEMPLSSIRRPPGTEPVTFRHFGFGFDTRTGDYKVIRFVDNCYDDSLDSIVQVELYSLKNDSWREIHIPVDDVFKSYVFDCRLWEIPCEDVPFLWTGAVGAIGVNDKMILSFDFGNEVFKKILLPDFGDSRGVYSLTLAMYNGLLAVIRCTQEGQGRIFDILAMNELGGKESWVKRVSIGPISGVKRPLVFSINGDLFLADAEEHLFLCDTGDEKVMNLELHGRRGLQVVNYVESLVPINGGQEYTDGLFARTSLSILFPGQCSSDVEEEEDMDSEA